MSHSYGEQHQTFAGLNQLYAQAHPAVAKFIDPDDNIARLVKQLSPNTTTIVRVYTGQPTVDDAGQHPDPERYGYDYATRVYAAVKDPAHMDLLESENEPNDHYNNLTEFIKRLNAFLVGFSRRARELGFRPLGPNFSTGYPEVFVPGSDYVLWPDAWRGLTDGLLALQSAGGALGLHEYDAPDLLRLWSAAKQRGYLVGRHKAVYAALGADLQSLPLYLTEFGIDYLVYGVDGGFWHNRDENAPTWMVDQMRQAWSEVYSTTPQLKGICQFLWNRNDPRWEEYDCARTTTSVQTFTDYLKEAATIQPPQGEHMEPTPAQTVANVPFLVKASLQAKYGPGGLGQPVYGEYEAIGDGNEKWPAWIFLRGGLKVKAGNYADFGGVKLFNPTSGEAMTDPLPWPDGGGGQPPSMNRLTTADFAAAGWPFEVTPCTPAPGQKFFGLVGYSDFKSGPSVGTETRCQVVDANGAILAGYKVAHAYDSTNHKSETFPSPTGFVLGTGSYIPNGAHPQDLFYVARAGTPDGHADNWPDGYPSDIFRGGMPGQEHFEGRIWWQLMTG